MKLYAGDAPASPLPAGCAARIMTGAPLPEGADCVLMQELTDSGEETVQLYAAMKPQQNVVFRGGDIAAGAVIAEAGTVLSPAHLGVLAGQGYAEVPVYKHADRGRPGHRQRASSSGRGLDARQNLRRQRRPERRPPAAAGLCGKTSALLRRPGGDCP